MSNQNFPFIPTEPPPLDDTTQDVNSNSNEYDIDFDSFKGILSPEDDHEVILNKTNAQDNIDQENVDDVITNSNEKNKIENKPVVNSNEFDLEHFAINNCDKSSSNLSENINETPQVNSDGQFNGNSDCDFADFSAFESSSKIQTQDLNCDNISDAIDTNLESSSENVNFSNLHDKVEDNFADFENANFNANFTQEENFGKNNDAQIANDNDFADFGSFNENTNISQTEHIQHIEHVEHVPNDDSTNENNQQFDSLVKETFFVNDELQNENCQNLSKDLFFYADSNR